MTMKKKIIYSIGLATILMITGCSSSEPENSEQDPEELIIEAPKEKPQLAHTCSGGNDNGTKIATAIYKNSDGKACKLVVNVSNGKILDSNDKEKIISYYMNNFDLPENQVITQDKDGETVAIMQFNSFDELNNKYFKGKLENDTPEYILDVFKNDETYTACDGEAIRKDSETQSQSQSSVPTSGIRPEFKEMMDNFVVFYQQYADFMNNADPNSSDYYTKYIEVMQQYTDTMAAMEKVEDMDMNTDEMKYYLEKMAEIQQILATVQTN